MELYRPRSSSIPRQLRQMPAHERFTVTHAAQLKLQLQALNDKLEPDAPVDLLREACQSRPFHEAIYVPGSEELYLLVKVISRPDLIPHVYLDAYLAVQHGRFPVNHYAVSDFRKGVDPTFSELRPLLSQIDDMCATNLYDAFCTLENQAKPFPFLSLPAELRLHIYSHLLPREAHLAVLHQPPPNHKPPRINLDVLRTNHQLYHEVVKYLYEDRTRDKLSLLLSDEYISRYYETVASMSPDVRSLFRKMEIHVGFLSHQTFFPRKHQYVRSTSNPMHHIMGLLHNLEIIAISTRASLPSQRATQAFARVATQEIETIEWLLSSIPPEIEIRWALSGAIGDDSENIKIKQFITSRGPLLCADSIMAQR